MRSGPPQGYFGSWIGLALLQNFQSVDLRQLEVQQNQFDIRAGARPAIPPRAEQTFQRLFAVPHHVNLVRQMMFPECPQGDLDVFRVVLNQQNFHVSVHDKAFRREKKNVAPPSTLPSAQARPPCRRTIRWTMANPTPVPSKSSFKCRR